MVPVVPTEGQIWPRAVTVVTGGTPSSIDGGTPDSSGSGSLDGGGA